MKCVYISILMYMSDPMKAHRPMLTDQKTRSDNPDPMQTCAPGVSTIIGSLLSCSTLCDRELAGKHYGSLSVGGNKLGFRSGCAMVTTPCSEDLSRDPTKPITPMFSCARTAAGQWSGTQEE